MKLEAEKLTVVRSGRRILNNITFFLEGTGLYAILGRNGSGKSTLLKTLVGLLPFRGRITIDGKNLLKYTRKELSRKVGYLWQNPYYGFFESTVEREIRFILKNTGVEGRFDWIVDFFGIRPLLNRSPFSLSGGEAKRVAIASVFVADQPIMLLDEPESELDFEGLRKLVEFLVSESRRKLVVLATHNTIFLYRLRSAIQKILILEGGTLRGVFDTDVLLDDDTMSSVGVVPLSWWFS